MKNLGITNNKGLLSHFENYSNWSHESRLSRWMIVLTIQGVPHHFYTHNKDSATTILNEVAETVDRRFFNRLFMDSRGSEFSLDFYRIARGSQGTIIMNQVS